MSLKRKVKQWTECGIINQSQGEQIISLESKSVKNVFWTTAFTITGLLIGCGFCLIIAANWDKLGDFVKLAGDFTIFGAIICALIWSIANNKPFLKETLLVMSFFMVGATIGLISQIFHISGGWSRFAFAWAVLSFPFVIISNVVALNFGWVCVFVTMFNFGLIDKLFHFCEHHIIGFPLVTVCAIVLSHACDAFSRFLKKCNALPKAFSWFALTVAYVSMLVYEIQWGGGWRKYGFCSKEIAHALIFTLLSVQIFIATRASNILSFKCNAGLLEIYIIYLFCSYLGDFLKTGIGFIIGGIVLMLSLYVLKKAACGFSKKIGANHEK